MRILLVQLLIGGSLTQAADSPYRCDCKEFSYYWNPLSVLRDTLSFFRPNWPPRRVEVQSTWNDPKFPDYFKVEVLFTGKEKDHLVHLDFFNTHGASTFNEDYYHQEIFSDNGSKLFLSESSFPWFRKESGFRCEEIPNGESVKYTNSKSYEFDHQSPDPCWRRKAIKGKIEVKIQSEVSECNSEFSFESELEFISSLDIFDFCQTPRILSLRSNPRRAAEDGRYIDSDVHISYECKNGQRYTALIEHFVIDKTDQADLCPESRVDPFAIFPPFYGNSGSNYCTNARIYLDQSLAKSGFKMLQTKNCLCGQTSRITA
jgi:hypothetical protein